MQKTPSFCSWSGGKDSALALYHARSAGHDIKYLFTMLTESGDRSRSHGLRRNVIKRQADALGLELRTRNASWNNYEQEYISGLAELRNCGVQSGIFGDIDIEDHRQWCEKVCRHEQMAAIHPLWQQARRSLVEDCLKLGFQAKIVAVRDTVLPKQFLGRVLSSEIIAEFEALGVDACGENGEFHTVVFDGPIFSHPVLLKEGVSVLRDGCSFLDLE